MNGLILLSSFVLGIGGSLHCLGMCGPLALSVPFAQNDRIKWLRITVFYLGKSFAYGLLGMLPGLFGKGLILMDWQQGLSITAGIAILLMVAVPTLKLHKSKFLFRKQFSLLYNRLQQQARLTDYGILGFLNGLLPCGLVYTALTAATLSGSWAGGFLAMFLFGLGTTPALVALILFRNKLNRQQLRNLKPVSAILSICVGVLLILRGLNLGIPYVSPEFKDNSIKSCCAHKTNGIDKP